VTKEEQWFVEGFVKRAQDYGIQPEVAENLLPKKKIVLPGNRSANVTKKTPSALNKFDHSSLKKLPEKQPEKPVWTTPTGRPTYDQSQSIQVRDAAEEWRQQPQAQREYEELEKMYREWEKDRRERDRYRGYEYIGPKIEWYGGYPYVFPRTYHPPY
jgi:hypothetical protein